MAGASKARAVLVAVVIAVVIAGCGSDESTSGSSSPSTDTTASKPDSTSAGGGGTEKKDRGGDQSRDGGKQGAGPGDNGTDSRSGGGPESQGDGSPETDRSIQEFGGEASDAEREAASQELEAYFRARAASENQAACAHLSAEARGQLAELAATAPKIKGKGCVAAFDSIDDFAPPSARVNPMTGPISSLRTEGGSAFAIFPGKGGAVYAIQMSRDRGSWKVAALVPYQLN